MLTGTRNETYSFGEFVKKDRDGERREAGFSSKLFPHEYSLF